LSILARFLKEPDHRADPLSGCAQALHRPVSTLVAGQQLDEELPRGKHPFSRTRQYRVYLPAGYDERQPATMVMVLHGCSQSNLDIQQIAAFDAIADRENFVVVYPSVTSYIGMRNFNCWGWWIRAHRERNRGEVEDLARIARHLTKTLNLDSDRRFICGLSSGAAMSVASLVAANDTWKAGASIAGVAYGESPRSVRISKHLSIRHRPMTSLMRSLQGQLGNAKPPPLLIVQSEADMVVSPDCAERLTDQWLLASDLASEPDSTLQGMARGKQFRLQSHADATGLLQVLTLRIDRISHSWFGGGTGTFSTPVAPNLSELVWEFFSRHH